MANLIKMINAVIIDRRSAAERNRGYREAIRELEAYNDEELMDLGIARYDIPHVVKYGYTDRGSHDCLLACECEQAVHEQERCSTPYLDDLGLVRREIFRAEKYGCRDDMRNGDFQASCCTDIILETAD